MSWIHNVNSVLHHRNFDWKLSFYYQWHGNTNAIRARLALEYCKMNEAKQQQQQQQSFYDFSLTIFISFPLLVYEVNAATGYTTSKFTKKSNAIIFTNLRLHEFFPTFWHAVLWHVSLENSPFSLSLCFCSVFFPNFCLLHSTINTRNIFQEHTISCCSVNYVSVMHILCTILAKQKATKIDETRVHCAIYCFIILWFYDGSYYFPPPDGTFTRKKVLVAENLCQMHQNIDICLQMSQQAQLENQIETVGCQSLRDVFFRISFWAIDFQRSDRNTKKVWGFVMCHRCEFAMPRAAQ